MKTLMLKIMILLIALAAFGCAGGVITECCDESQRIIGYYVEQPPTGSDPADYLLNWVEYHPYGERCVGWPDQSTDGEYEECIAIYDMNDPQEICAAREFLGVPSDLPVWTPTGDAIYPPCE